MPTRMSRSHLVVGILISVVVVVAQITSGAASRGQVAGEGPKLINVAKKAGLPTHQITWGATEFDYNLDGKLDVWIGKHFHGGRLWRNRGINGYVELNTAAWPHYNDEGQPIDRHDCAWADVDRNGLPDAYCSAGRFTSNIVKTGRGNELWLQGPAGEFRDVGAAWGVDDICSRGRNVVFLHASGDARPDLFVGNEVPRKEPDPCNRHPELYPNEKSKLFINKGDKFKYVKRKFNYGGGPGARCAEEIDFDQDGWKDILACGPDDSRLHLFRNRQGHGFADATERLPQLQVRDAVRGDIDGDHDTDVILASKKGFYYSLNNNGRFRPRVLIGSFPRGAGRAVAVGDVDSDGDLDVFGTIRHLGHRNPDDRLFLNDGLDFTVLIAPSALGTADEVITLHPRKDGPAQFLVMNGYHHTANPNIQLIKLQR